MKAKTLARDYQALFGGLAREFGVTLVAGSIVLPEPTVSDGQLEIGRGALYNSTLVFGSNGLPIGQPQRQLNPGLDKRDFIQPGADQAVNVIDTPAGRLGVLIGNDSWYPDNYRKLNAEGAQLIAVPAFVVGRGAWDKPWHGYKSLPMPNEISLKSGELSEGDAWHRLTLTRQPLTGMSVFLRGQFWDQGSDGQSFISSNGQTIADGNARGARLLNIWL
jgi:predicted amidohydrolase